MIKKIIFCIKVGGLSYIVELLLDKLFNLNLSKNKLYKILENTPSEQYKEVITLLYGRFTGKKLDLDYPKTFNEKIQWLKLYDSTPIKSELADKYAVRNYVSNVIGETYLIPLLGVWECFDDIDFEKLPEQFVLKANHGSKYNLIVHNKYELDKQKAKKLFDEWMTKNYAYAAGLELHYANIPHKIIAEKYLEEVSESLYDYRIFCFNGKAKYIWVDQGASDISTHRRNIYDTNWVFQNYQVNYPNMISSPEKPDKYDEMIFCAEKLAQGFSFVRVDLYCVKEKIYFGEMTFTAGSGYLKWEDEKKNMQYGNLIILPEPTEWK